MASVYLLILKRFIFFTLLQGLIFNNFERNIYFFTIYNLLSKDIKLYLTSNNALIKFINYNENIKRKKKENITN